MCGIAGIVQLDDQRVSRATITRFIGALPHRGPDGEAVVLEDDERVALGHRRLAILDLTDAARQPMTSASGRYVISYNGEIYNFLELRRLLERQGLRFRSESDTEVLLGAFERWGPDCLLRFNGMWSIAIWDRRERRTVPGARSVRGETALRPDHSPPARLRIGAEGVPTTRWLPTGREHGGDPRAPCGRAYRRRSATRRGVPARGPLP